MGEGNLAQNNLYVKVKNKTICLLIYKQKLIKFIFFEKLFPILINKFSGASSIVTEFLVCSEAAMRYDT